MARKNFSRKREAILEVICSTKSHPSAEWVYNSLKDEYPKLSLGTVYRNMGMFKDMGLIQSVGNVNGQERFDGNVKPHPHFICNTCGAVIDVDDIDYNEHADALIEKTHGHDVLHHKIYFYGKCYACKVKKEKN